MRFIDDITRGAAVLAFAAGTMASGCGGSKEAPSASGALANKAAEKIAEAALSQSMGDVKVNIDGDNVTFSGTTAETGGVSASFGDGAGIPEGFPKDVPLPDGIAVQMSLKMDERQGFQVQATTAKSFDELVAHFQNTLAAQGWNEVANMNQIGAMMMAQYEKDGRELHVQVSNSGDERHIMVMTAQGTE